MSSSRAQSDFASRFTGVATGRPATALKVGAAAWWLIAATAGGAVAGGGAAEARRVAVAARSGFALTLLAAVAKAEHLVAVIVVRAAPNTVTIFAERPHKRGSHHRRT